MSRPVTKAGIEARDAIWKCNNRACRKFGLKQEPVRIAGKRFCGFCGQARR